MATLVLTTVGGAIGGPIGAALGGIVGQGIDRAVLRPGGRREGARLSDLKVQLSSYGMPIAKLFGTLRVAGCVIWATDLIETRNTSRGGKGQPGVTNYSYSASFAVALSARPIVAVRRIWADGKLLRGAAGDWKATTAFRLHTGSEDQAPDPLIAALEPHAPAHRGIAYAVFEGLQLADFGNRIPSLTFEVVADAQAPRVDAVMQALSQGATTRGGPDVSIGGFAASDSVATSIGSLRALAGVPLVPHGGALRLAEDETAPARAIDGDVSDIRRPADAIPRTLSLSYYDPDRDYQLGVQRARRPDGPGWRDETIDLPVALSAAQAALVAEAMLRQSERGLVTRRVVLPASDIAIAPGDVVTFADAGGRWRVTRTALESMTLSLDLVPLPTALVPIAADAGRATLAPDIPLGQTRMIAVELPPLDDELPASPAVTIIAAGTRPGWRAAALLTSRDDGASWDVAGTTAAPAMLGAIAGPLRAAPVGLIDLVNRIEVEFPHDDMTLESVTGPMFGAGGNLALVGGEIVQFRDAVQTAARRWTLTTLLRGRRGTDPASHAVGTPFALLERDTMRVLPLPGARPGERVRLLASAIGEALAPATAQVALDGASVAPPSPVHLRHRWRADGGITFTWVRRSRLGWRWDDGIDVPLGEEAESYLVTVDTSEGVRTIVVSSPELALTPDERGSGSVRVAVRQQGTHAASRPIVLTI